MGWGDPYDGMYVDDDDRRSAAATCGFTPGALVTYGLAMRPGLLNVWTAPDPGSQVGYGVTPCAGIVVSVDLESDPVEAWAAVLLQTREGLIAAGYVPAGLLRTRSWP